MALQISSTSYISEVAENQYFKRRNVFGSLRKQSLCIITRVRLRTSDPPRPQLGWEYIGYIDVDVCNHPLLILP